MTTNNNNDDEIITVCPNTNKNTGSHTYTFLPTKKQAASRPPLPLGWEKKGIDNEEKLVSFPQPPFPPPQPPSPYSHHSPTCPHPYISPMASIPQSPTTTTPPP